jgi:hypothetical protein
VFNKTKNTHHHAIPSLIALAEIKSALASGATEKENTSLDSNNVELYTANFSYIMSHVCDFQTIIRIHKGSNWSGREQRKERHHSTENFTIFPRYHIP